MEKQITIRCLDNNDSSISHANYPCLTINKLYQVISEDIDTYCIIDDTGNKNHWFKDRFKIVSNTNKLIDLLENEFSLHEADKIYNMLHDDTVESKTIIDYVNKIHELSKYDNVFEWYKDNQSDNFFIVRNSADKFLLVYITQSCEYDYPIPTNLDLQQQVEFVTNLINLIQGIK